jgi:hypothetical protein
MSLNPHQFDSPFQPRGYWSHLTDAELVTSRDEYREKACLFDADFAAELRQVADDIDDDLRLRAEWRERRPAAYSSTVAANRCSRCTGKGE